MPTVSEALQQLDRELARARQAGCKVLKLVHGYGSSGAGGEIRIAAQRRLMEMKGRGEIRACIFGEDWSNWDAVSLGPRQRSSRTEAGCGPGPAESGDYDCGALIFGERVLHYRLFHGGVMLSLRSMWREAQMQSPGYGAVPARSFGTRVPQDDAGGEDRQLAK